MALTGLLLCATPPQLAAKLVAIRPASLRALVVQEELYRDFGGRAGQWIVLVRDADRRRAMTRADRISEALMSLPGTEVELDSLTSWLPSVQTQEQRLAARDLLDLPQRARDLSAALAELGFDVRAFQPALDAFLLPSRQLMTEDEFPSGAHELLVSRHLGQDGQDWVTAIFVRPEPDARLEWRRRCWRPIPKHASQATRDSRAACGRRSDETCPR